MVRWQRRCRRASAGHVGLRPCSPRRPAQKAERIRGFRRPARAGRRLRPLDRVPFAGGEKEGQEPREGRAVRLDSDSLVVSARRESETSDWARELPCPVEAPANSYRRDIWLRSSD